MKSQKRAYFPGLFWPKLRSCGLGRVELLPLPPYCWKPAGRSPATEFVADKSITDGDFGSFSPSPPHFTDRFIAEGSCEGSLTGLLLLLLVLLVAFDEVTVVTVEDEETAELLIEPKSVAEGIAAAIAAEEVVVSYEEPPNEVDLL